jgi:hypothetical protein
MFLRPFIYMGQNAACQKKEIVHSVYSMWDPYHLPVGENKTHKSQWQVVFYLKDAIFGKEKY